MSDFNLLAATRNIEKSMPFVLYRFGLCFGVGFGYLFASLCGAGIAIAVDYLGKNPNAFAPYGGVAGFAAFGFLMYKLRPYWLHWVEARQLALLAEQAQGRPIPEGMAQVELAKQRVAQGFPSTAGLYALDRQIQTVLAELPAAPAGVGHPQAACALRWVMGRVSALNHQTILAWHFYSHAENPWRTAALGLAVQHRHLSVLLKYRLYATVFEWLGLAAAFPLILVGIEKLTADLPFGLGVWAYLFAGVFAWTLKAAFFEPIAEAAMMGVFFPLAEQPAAAEAAELARRSPAFQAIQAKAGRV